MLKKLMSKNLNILTILSTGLSFAGFTLSIQDLILKNKFVKLQERNEILEKQINELKIDELKNEFTKDKVEYFRTSLEESQSKITKQLESIQNLNTQTKTNKDEINYQLENLTKENENMQDIMSEILKFFKDNNKFLGDNNIFEIFNNFINNFNKIFSNLSFEQQGAIAHLSGSICILINVLTIISVLFGDQIVLYLKLEERFPKFSFILKLRKRLNNISLIFSLIIIISISLAMIYVNSLILIHF
uniref:hypothetical protein n=1 Tax=Amanita sinensis TaxID=67728 RepID=UPI001D123AFD|nr:hypothetical protein LK379_mgp22 [Amanita sinensis]QZN08167.1 hypothetical protein [Amanita sinensis]